MTEEELIRFTTSLPSVRVHTASQQDGAPEVAWGDSFFYADADSPGGPSDQKLPFATIVVKDYPGWDTTSRLDRPGVFRLNVAVGRRRFQELLGYPPEAQPEHQTAFDYTALDQVIPHPVYATQGWVSILNPGPQTDDLARRLLEETAARAASRERRAV